MKKCLIYGNSTFISNNQAAIVADPRKGPLNFPSFAIAPELSAILNFGFLSVFSVWADKLYLTITQIFSQFITVIGTVANQTLWITFRSSRTISRHLDLSQNLSTSVTSCGDAEAMVLPRGIPWPSTTTIHFDPLPLLVFPTPMPLFLPV